MAGRRPKATRCCSWGSSRRRRGGAARPAGRRRRPAWTRPVMPIFLAVNAAEALLAVGRTAEAAALIDPLTTGPPDRDHWLAHECRAEIDLLRGDIDGCHPAAAADQGVQPSPAHDDSCPRWRQRAAELALWAGRPADALEEVRRVLALFTAPDLTILCGRLLAAGMRACADLAEQARARRDDHAADAALAAADGLASWVDQMAGAPFTDHPFVATIPAERATWDAERDPAGRAKATPRRGARRRRPGRTWAARTAPGTPGGGRPRRSWTPGSPPPRRPPRCGPPRPPPTGTRRCWPRSARSPSGPASRCTRRRTRSPRRRRRTLWRPTGSPDGSWPCCGLVAAGRDQRADRRRAVHQPQDRRRPRHQHLAQARRVQPGPGRRPRRTRRAGPHRAGLNTARRNLNTRPPQPGPIARSAPCCLSRILGTKAPQTSPRRGQ